MPRNRKNGSEQEEKRLRAMGQQVASYVDYVNKTLGSQRHRFLRGLFVFSCQVTEAVFSQAVQRALRYRVAEEKVIRKYAAYDCLVIDEVGYVEVEAAQVGLFFTLMQKRHKHKTTLITSNLGFSEWNSFLKNPHLTAALIDRLTENSHVINMTKCRSLRDKLEDNESEDDEPDETSGS